MEESKLNFEKVKSLCMKNKVVTAVIGIVILLGIIAGWYFLYWVKTPAYSLQIIKEAVQKHDAAAFNQHVDTQMLYGKLFDDFMDYSMKKEGMDNNPFTVGLISSLKPMVVSYLIAETNNAISSDKPISKDAKDNPANAIIEDTGVSHTTFIDIADTTKTDDGAVVSVRFNDTQVGKEFIIKLKMTELTDGTWKVVSIDNLPEYLDAYGKAKEEKLNELNEPIQKQIDAIAVIDNNVQPMITANSFFSTLIASFTVKNTSTNETVKSMTISTQVTDADGNVLFTDIGKTNTRIAAGQNNTLTFTHQLNPFIGNEQKIASLGAGNINIQFKITEVVTDSNDIKLLTELPE